jgi:ABC-type multidrug transport system ATPase subunit
MIAATHLMDEAERCDVLAILDQGRLVAIDTPALLIDGLGGESIWLDCSNGMVLNLSESIFARFGWDCTPRRQDSPDSSTTTRTTSSAALHESLGTHD